MPILELTSRERSDLRSAAHPLRPVVLIGDNGLTEAVLKEIDRALSSHGLIKVRVAGDDREARVAIMASICESLSCANVHHLGKMLIVFRPQSGNIKPVGDVDANDDRANKRRASEPHTPKKLAAQGKILTKRSTRKAPAVVEDAKPVSRFARGELNKAGKPMRPSTKKSASDSHGIPRRSGSALSLRAGARTGTQRPATSRKSPRSTKR